MKIMRKNMSNGILFQGFEWYLPDDGNYYKDMLLKLDELSAMGITAIWLPPVCKGTWTNDTGYGVYDLYDLGEFDQKGAVRTKYGVKEDLKILIDAIHQRGMQVYADVVLNHKAGADGSERFMAVKVDSNDRTKEVEEPREIEGWTVFKFPGRQGKYSQFEWNFQHFTGVDFDYLTGDKGIYRILGVWEF
jgi:alpha-amylase